MTPMDPSAPGGMTGTLRENIAALTERQRQERADAPLTHKLADAVTRFTGSMGFVGLHIVLFGGWIVWNLWGSPKFDPSFVVLAMVASVEAIFLSTFVLISQNRMAAAADRRADLDLHINLLAEHELTKLAQLVERMAERMGIPADEPDFAEIKSNVAPVQVLDALDARRKAEGLES
jgi:uncharacterized membrane protein